MKKIARLLIASYLFLAVGALLTAQETPDEQPYRQYRGEVVDEQSKEPLVFATLSLEEHNISTVTNSEGAFLLKVPLEIADGAVAVSFLGYKTRKLPLSNFAENGNVIPLEVSVTNLAEVDVVVPKDATLLVKEVLRKKGENYFEDPTRMTAFYRETIKKRRRNVSLSEAVVTIYKAPYTSDRQDAVELFKARKSTDYTKLDTVALKLQGGPFNALFVDIMKYPEYIFSDDYIDSYNFYFDRSTRINDRLIFVVGFEQRSHIKDPMYKGKLYIDGERKILTSAIFSLNITDRNKASRMFVRRKPANASVYPTEVSYRVDYREKDGRWYYGYSNAILEFKIDWDKRLFNSVYSLTCEMAITDWEKNQQGTVPRFRNRVKSSIILSDEAIGFADPDFWGEYNIIEPDKTIESAIRKIQRQLRRTMRDDPGAAR